MQPKYKIYLETSVISHLLASDTPDRYNNIVLDNNIIELAYRYIEKGAFTERHIFDALHVAAASVGCCDVLVSWDMRHIVREKTILGVNEVNCSEGLNPLKITTPQNFEEVI